MKIITLQEVIREVEEQRDIFWRLIDDSERKFVDDYDRGSYDAYTFVLEMLQRVKEDAEVAGWDDAMTLKLRKSMQGTP